MPQLFLHGFIFHMGPLTFAQVSHRSAPASLMAGITGVNHHVLIPSLTEDTKPLPLISLLSKMLQVPRTRLYLEAVASASHLPRALSARVPQPGLGGAQQMPELPWPPQTLDSLPTHTQVSSVRTSAAFTDSLITRSVHCRSANI
jgi:hypothetical protein